MFENLNERLEGAFKLLKGESRITELNIAASVKEIRRALVDADVNYKIAKEFTDKVKEKAMAGLDFLNKTKSPNSLLYLFLKFLGGFIPENIFVFFSSLFHGFYFTE